MPSRSFTTRLSLALALLLLAYGCFVALLGRQVAAEREQETLQRLSHGQARHTVEHWPEIASHNRDEAERSARGALLATLMTVNPGVQVYLLDNDGRVQHYIGQPAMVQQAQVGPDRLWRGAALAAAMGLLVTLGLRLFTFRRMTLPLHQRAASLRGYSQGGSSADRVASTTPTPAAGDEVRATTDAFAGMTRRIESHGEREKRQVAGPRELMASVAHDLRTPLTALHGHLEALAGETAPNAPRRAAVLQAALAQSRKVSRLSQQLFELAALQSPEQVLHRGRFSLDDLVTDAVQKFGLVDALSMVTLHGLPPGRLELDGDLQLIERALTNLIDNAVRHAPGSAAVRVSLRREGSQAEVVVEDAGPGLPDELHQRLDQGLSLRDPPIKRSSGGIGGLGLVIAQRVTVLHSGSLRPLPAPLGGTRLCLALPLVI